MLMINLFGLALIALIVWWFWLYKPKEVALGETTQVISVNNGSYTPGHIKLPAGVPTTLYFLRQDPSPCAETLLIPELDISTSLPLNKRVAVEVPASKPGKYPFHCQMQMYRGELIIE